MIHKVIFNIGARIRTPNLKTEFKFLKDSEKWSTDKLEKYQVEQLKKILNNAYNNSLFYKELYDSSGFNPKSIKLLSDIKKIPIVTKKDIINNTEKIQLMKGYKKLFLSETSGSTGQPLTFYKSSNWDSKNRAAQFRGYSWYGVKPWEKNGYFWGFNFSNLQLIKTKINDLLINRFRSFSYSKSEIYKFTKKLKRAQYLEGYSSMIYETAKVINNNSLGTFKLKMVKGTSEKIYNSYQHEAKKAFGKKIISEYGSAETGLIAFECPCGNMHIAMENVIVEEENNEAIITNLMSDSFPIIRYKLGDYIELDEGKKCECGMEHKIVKSVLGRVGKSIHGYKQKYPSLVLYYIFKNLTLNYGVILNYQAIQKERGNLIIYLDNTFDNKTESLIEKECFNYFNDDVKVIIINNTIKKNYESKRKDFISYLD